MGSMRSALYIDFDNFFGGLIAADPVAALAVIERPSTWINRLVSAHDDGLGRRWLVLRCYMNPGGSVPDPFGGPKRLYFSRFRSSFTQAGVEVVDCPSLTHQQKNGADIRIAVDILTALRAPTRYDEFVIASADSDFTPLLQAVRADDRRTTMIATQSTVVAYEALADRFLDEQDVIELASVSAWADDDEAAADDDGAAATDGTGVGVGDGVGTGEAPAVVRTAAVPVTAEDAGNARELFEREVRRQYETATEPINLAQLSSDLLETIGRNLSGEGWFGTGSFVRALQALQLPGACFSTYFLWDSTRHEEPAPTTNVHRNDIPGLILQFSQVTNLPLIDSTSWPAVYASLAAYAARGDFNLTESSRWSRDDAADRGVSVGRGVFSYVVRACRSVGAPLDGKPAPTAQQIAAALLTNTLQKSTVAGFRPSDAETREIATWLHYEDATAEPATLTLASTSR
ncbi:hypothetical protein BKD30_06370 [Tersicoccus phoenicis]|uniref:NYN domain-containing protein n=1 Tax=Tersicoccus phoenicis TaxID=554083 RepID=A0A1R1LCB5_9MICC|nr:NYN domain-containing protein [Tersicoccus phoenicis]OMH25170.1 hypothetical protein BKD30_06370 [Tersicoccus phoenicis]